LKFEKDYSDDFFGALSECCQGQLIFMFNKKTGQAILVCEECSRKIAKIKIVKIFEAKDILDSKNLELITDENEKYPFKKNAEHSN
jgi:hypothetical protein